LTHNLLILLRRELEREHGIRGGKVEQKRQQQLIRRRTQARALGRSVAAIQKFLPVAIQLTAPLIRILCNGFLLGMRWRYCANLQNSTYRFHQTPLARGQCRDAPVVTALMCQVCVIG